MCGSGARKTRDELLEEYGEAAYEDVAVEEAAPEDDEKYLAEEAAAKAKTRGSPVVKKTINKKSAKPSPKYSPKPSGSNSFWGDFYEHYSLEGTRQTPGSLKAADVAHNDLVAEIRAECSDDDSVADA